jgi:hypothetical protein
MSSKERRGSWPGAPRRPNLDACPGRPLTNDATRWTAGSSSPQVLSASASGPPAARLIGVAELVDTAVAGPAVGDHPRARLDVLGEAGVQRGGRPIGQDRHPSSSVPVRLLNLNGHAYNAFLPLARPPRSPGSAPPMYVSSTSAVPVSRSRPGRTSTERSRCSIAHAVAYEPISARPLQAQRRHAVLARGEQPAGLQPHRQRRSSAIEQRPDGGGIVPPRPVPIWVVWLSRTRSTRCVGSGCRCCLPRSVAPTRCSCARTVLVGR